MIKELYKQELEDETLMGSFSKYVQKEDQNNPFVHYLGYIIDNKIVGILIYTMIYDRAEIEQIEVLQEKRHQNIASKMMEHFLDQCVKEKMQNITLEVQKDNEIAIKLYHKYGFQNRAVRKNYYHGIDGILMEKEVIK